MAKFLVGSAFTAALLFGAGPASSQSETGAAYPPPAPATGNYPSPPPATPQQGQAAPSPAAPPPPNQQAPYSGAPPPPNQQAPYSGAPPPPSQQAPYPATPPQQAQPPAGTYPAYGSAPPPSTNYATSPGYQGTTPGNNYGQPVVEPPAPAPKEEKAFEFPDISVRVDPLNWLIYGRLGLELEAAVWKFVSVEVVPVFVTDEQPPYMNLGSVPANVYQKSNGVGAMSGASIGAGFWLNQNPFRGTVFRVLFTNYGYTYETTDDAGRIDSASHTDRRIYGFLGSHSKWGPFTIASGIGLGAELNRERRCMDTSTAAVAPTTVGCKKEVFDLQLERGRNSTYGVYGWLHPAYLDFRLSLGFVLD